MRITESQLSTAVRTLVHPRSGRTVTLVGTMHVGEERYFSELSALIADRAAQGAVVHVEGIGHRHDDSMRGWELNCLAAAYSWADPEKTGPATALRAESQGACLRLPEDATNIDFAHIELLRRLGWANYRRLFAAPLAESPVAVSSALTRVLIRFRLRHRRALACLKALRGRNRLVNRVVIDDRNRLAFSGAVEALAETDVVLVWGADHLPGLTRLFALLDYALHDEQWFEACAI